jgi:hypothetical protein
MKQAPELPFTHEDSFSQHFGSIAIAGTSFLPFCKRNPKETFVAGEIKLAARGKVEGYAVVLIRCDEKSLTFMNSWGRMWASNGFFTVNEVAMLEIAGGPRVQFYDIYLATDQLSAQDVAA